MIELFIIYYVFTTLILLYDIYLDRDIAHEFSTTIIIFGILVAITPVLNMMALSKYVRYIKN